MVMSWWRRRVKHHRDGILEKKKNWVVENATRKVGKTEETREIIFDIFSRLQTLFYFTFLFLSSSRGVFLCHKFIELFFFFSFDNQKYIFWDDVLVADQKQIIVVEY